jgi:hypothetical protein
MGRVKFRKLTRTEYASIKAKDPDTIYFVTADRLNVNADMNANVDMRADEASNAAPEAVEDDGVE